MRGLSVDILALVAIVGLAWVIYKALLKHQMTKRLSKTAHFIGGPLNATDERLEKLPASIHHVYDRPQLVTLKEGGKPVPVQTWQEAIYSHQGNGIYEYQGSIPVKGLEYDTGDD